MIMLRSENDGKVFSMHRRSASPNRDRVYNRFIQDEDLEIQ